MNSISQSPLRSLLRDVKELELVARRNVSSHLSGNYLTSIPGRGLEFHEARPYLPGDPDRHIDWNMTARLGQPWVKTFLEEREREIMLLVDVSPSMDCGWVQRTKLELATEVAATLAISAVEAGDRIGLVTFADEVRRKYAPRSGKRQLFRILRELAGVAAQELPPSGFSDPRQAIHSVESMRSGRYIIFLLSDFIDHDVPDDLKYLRTRHDVSLIHLYDPLEVEVPESPVRFTAISPEGEVRPMRTRPGEWRRRSETTTLLQGAAGRLGLDYLALATDAPVSRSLAAFFHRRKRGRQ